MIGSAFGYASPSLNVVGKRGTEYSESVLSFSPVWNASLVRSRLMSPAETCGLPCARSLNQFLTRLPVEPSLSVSRITSEFGRCVGLDSITLSLSTHDAWRQPECLPRPGSSQPVWRSE